MFLLSKLLPLLVLPLGLALLLLLWGAVRGTRWPALAALALLWVFATPLVAEGLWRWLERPYQRQTATALLGPAREATARVSQAPAAVVVLGGGRHAAPGPARTSEWVDADRFFGGIEAYQELRRQGQRPRLIFTGGWWPLQPQLPPEGEVLRQQALELGLPAADLATTGRVRNTAEEARAIAAQLPAGSRVVLVTSAFHLPRARRLFERQGLQVLPYPVDFQASGAWAGHPAANLLNWIPSADGLERSSRALREALGRTLYRSW
ncbi:YdcF family protein [Cyanobium sp. Aljojuca 7D2]|uniref:YdcF family protein n=1 Tax=Cyanobium sp. Aljojuca 7D2 TaxID=2823698 RepID=UPI0020CC0C03|nr:YdcF family protein [Cyanobium sp. Aljojuca 7D2]